MRIAVTGASGNIGTHLLDHLHGDDRVTEVVAISRRPPDRPSGSLGGKVRWRSIDLARPGSQHELAEAVAGCSALVHLAWLLQPSHAPGLLRAANVEGSRRVFAAVRAAGIPALVHASSVGAYSPGPRGHRQDESWPTGGIPGSLYSAQKSEVERLLDGTERDAPDLRVVRIRPSIVVSGAAAAGQTRLFLGPFVPRPLLRHLPVLPLPGALSLQVVHSADVAAAFALAATGDVAGPLNVAGEPVLTPDLLGEVLGARPVRVPATAARAVLEVTWRLRLHPVDRGWLELALAVPLLDTTRARAELGWSPRHDARDALREAVDGIVRGEGRPTPALRPIRSVADQVAGGLRALTGRSGGRL